MHSSPWFYLKSHSQAFTIRPAFKNGFIGLVFCIHGYMCFSLAARLSYSPTLFSKTSTSLGWWRQLPAEADCALTPLRTLDQSISLKNLGATRWPPCHGVPARGVLSGQSSQALFSTMLISASELWQQADEPGLCGSFPTVPLSKQGFSLIKSRENSSPGCCYEAAPRRAPVPICWSII